MTTTKGRWPCECDRYCEFFGDCCPQFQPRKVCPSEPEDGSSVIGQVLRSEFQCVRFSHNKNHGYLLVSACPSSWVDKAVRERCEQLPLKGISVGNVPVADGNRLSYRNVDCAKCHGVTDTENLKLWTSTLYCSEDIRNNISSRIFSLHEILSNELCEFDITPPNKSVSPAVRFCYDYNISEYGRCRSELTQELVDACNNYTARVAVSNSGGGKTLVKNPFCQYCEVEDPFSPKEWKADKFCSTSGIDETFPETFFDLSAFITSEESRKQDSGLAFVPISVLFDFNSDAGISIKIDNEEIVYCPVGKVYDEVTLSCVNLSRYDCSDGFEPLGADCVRFISEANYKRCVASEVSYLAMVSMSFSDSHGNTSRQEREMGLNCLRYFEVPGERISIIAANASSFIFRVDYQELFESFSELLDSIEANAAGDLIYIPNGNVIEFGSYLRDSNDTIRVCEVASRNGTSEEEEETSFLVVFSAPQTYLSLVCLLISLLSLSVTLATYFAFPSIRTAVNNRLIMALCLTLFLAQLLFLTNGFMTPYPRVCQAVAIVSHFLWLSVFTLSTALAIDLDRTFGSRRAITFSAHGTRTLMYYLAGAFGLPFFIVGACFITSLKTDYGWTVRYGGPSTCWIAGKMASLYAFGVPVAVALVVNSFLFTHTVYGIWKSKRVSRYLQGCKARVKHASSDLRIYLKISSLMGLTWAFGFIAAFVDVWALWYVFIILNGLQGFFIFLAFTANRRVYELWKALLTGPRKGASTTDHDPRTIKSAHLQASSSIIELPPQTLKGN
ncbi:uncharacterized protein [Diadema antillarum]|uniref:uncharacterized protein n=1 Tax=Diadema antillarum TaxID=105358 RepID=UPI003A8AF8F5